MRPNRRNLAICALLIVSATSQGWIDTGHMLVAAIAVKNLKPSVKAECDRLLLIGGDPRNTDFITTSPWADDIRRDRPETGPWHYIDFHFRLDGKPTDNKPDAENAVWAIEKFSAILKDKSRSDADRSEALRFLIHFVGDIHQPLHATACDSDEHPKGDKGGNDFRIIAPDEFKGMSRPPRNLHSFWDFGGGLFRGESRPLKPDSRARVEAQASLLVKSYPARSLAGVRDMKPLDWAQESFRASKQVVYGLPENTVPNAEYIKKAQEVCAQRITIAGYRLARLLNDLLK